MVTKDKAFVYNSVLERDIKRFFAMCSAAGLNSENQKRYYKKVLGVKHVADITQEQWDWIFEDMEESMKVESEGKGVIFANDLDEVLGEILV